MRKSPFAKVTVNLENLRHNIQILQKNTQAEIIPVVKSNAYGHGAEKVVETLMNEGVQRFAFTFLEEFAEAQRLFDSPNKKAFILSGVPKNPQFLKNTEFVVASDECLRRIKSISEPIKIHLKIDSGMGRLGFFSSEIPAILKKINSMKNVKIVGMMSHLSNSDKPKSEHTISQIEKFNKIVQKYFDDSILIHIANSGGLIHLTKAHFDAVRTGILLYGVDGKLGLKPVMRVHSQVIAIRHLRKGSPVNYGETYRMKNDGNIAIIALGYADGMPFACSNNGEILLHGKRYPIIGSVCMDYTTILLGNDTAKVGDEVVILGKQGNEEISAKEIADRAQTIPYDILCKFGAMANKNYE